jgi:hypothetical protein
LKWKNITPIKQQGKIIAAKIVVYQGEPEEYFSFISPEAYQSLEEWMEFRFTIESNLHYLTIMTGQDE